MSLRDEYDRLVSESKPNSPTPEQVAREEEYRLLTSLGCRLGRWTARKFGDYSRYSELTNTFRRRERNSLRFCGSFWACSAAAIISSMVA